MRVIAGKYRHRIINITNLETTRETQDKVRGAIFNSINYDIVNKTVLDLFAGSGSMGIEAISRGAVVAIFNDLNNKACAVIKNNLESLNITNYKLYNLDYKELLANVTYKFDYIFVDPPYKNINLEEMLNIIYNSNSSINNTIIVFEMGLNTKSITIDNIDIIKEKKYGSKKVVFYKINK